jgi:hypothetical protein
LSAFQKLDFVLLFSETVGGHALRWKAVHDAGPGHDDRLRQCWLNERRATFVAQRLERYWLPARAAVREFGSGTGWLPEGRAGRFPALVLCGLEPNDGYVAFAREKTGAKSVRHVPGIAKTAHRHLTRQFQVALSNDVLHHAIDLPARSAHHDIRWEW